MLAKLRRTMMGVEPEAGPRTTSREAPNGKQEAAAVEPAADHS
jgi:hypothetical protein